MEQEIVLSPRDDTYIGTAADEHVRGRKGDDRLEGRDGSDTLDGGLGADVLFGGNGADHLNGGRGRDILQGGAGTDRLNGGAGNDQLSGNGGADRFRGGTGADGITLGTQDSAASRVIYRNVNESRPDAPDRVLFFRSDEDIINLRRIDADATTSIDDAFVFIGDTAFTGTAGELRYTPFDEGFIEGVDVLADVDGDGVADFSIRVPLIDELAEGDFVL